jgi:hypothetical protein
MADFLVISATVTIGSILWLKIIKPWLDSRPPREAFVRPRVAGKKKLSKK